MLFTILDRFTPFGVWVYWCRHDQVHILFAKVSPSDGTVQVECSCEHYACEWRIGHLAHGDLVFSRKRAITLGLCTTFRTSGELSPLTDSTGSTRYL